MDVLIDDTVIDKDGRLLGKVTRVVNDSWTGKLNVFFYKSKDSEIPIKIDASAISEINNGTVKLSKSAGN